MFSKKKIATKPTTNPTIPAKFPKKLNGGNSCWITNKKRDASKIYLCVTFYDLKTEQLWDHKKSSHADFTAHFPQITINFVLM